MCVCTRARLDAFHGVCVRARACVYSFVPAGHDLGPRPKRAPPAEAGSARRARFRGDPAGRGGASRLVEEVAHGALRDVDEVGHLPRGPEAVVDRAGALAAARDRRRAAAHDAVRVLVELARARDAPAAVRGQLLVRPDQRDLRLALLEGAAEAVSLRPLILLPRPQAVDVGGVLPVLCR